MSVISDFSACSGIQFHRDNFQLNEYVMLCYHSRCQYLAMNVQAQTSSHWLPRQWLICISQQQQHTNNFAAVQFHINISLLHPRSLISLAALQRSPVNGKSLSW